MNVLQVLISIVVPKEIGLSNVYVTLKEVAFCSAFQITIWKHPVSQTGCGGGE